MKIAVRSIGSMTALMALTLAVAGNASAQARQFTAKVGIGQVSPQVHSGNVTAPSLPNTKADISDDARPVFSVGYGLTDNVSVALDAGLPFRLDLTGAGAIAGTGTLGTVRVIAPTLSLQYHFNRPGSLFRPYVGAGLSYVRFSDERGSGQLTAITNTGGAPVTFELDGRYSPTVQAGLTVRINEKWFADFAIGKTRLRTVAHFSTGQTLQMRMDPNYRAVALGYRF